MRLKDKSIIVTGSGGGIDVIDDDPGTLGSQPFGYAFANAAARAGDDDGFVFEAHGVLRLDKKMLNTIKIEANYAHRARATGRFD